MRYYERALAIRDEIVAHRRYLHANAEVGLEMPKARAYVMETLAGYGLEPKRCGHGVVATLGSGGRCILLRADMDALPMGEESGLDFACPTGRAAHCCGHDLHAAMLLGAAKLLKEDEASLAGTVKLMFQPAEETFQGARDMVAHGVLEDPAPDAALAVHVAGGHLPVGAYLYNDTGTMMNSADGFRIEIVGRGGHGARPNDAVDPIHIGAHICMALEALIAREADPGKSCVLSVCSFHAGTASNIIPDTAELQGTIRTNDRDAREMLVRRVREVAVGTAGLYGGTAEVELLPGVPPLACDPALTREIVGYIGDMGIPNAMPCPGVTVSASEDLAVIAERIPTTFLYLSAGYPDERGDSPAHDPKVRFNEDVCPVGTACLAHCAARWLSGHR